MKEFNKKGFPIIRLHEDHFEVKAIDYWEFRSFTYEEVVAIDYYNNKNKWWWPLVASSSIQVAYFSHYEKYRLKIVKENGGDWTYYAPHYYDESFVNFLEELIKRCGLEPEK